MDCPDCGKPLQGGNSICPWCGILIFNPEAGIVARPERLLVYPKETRALFLWGRFDGKIPGIGLPEFYEDHGFIPVGRLKFNCEYAPDDWNYKRDGEPDIIFYVHNGDSIEKILTPDYARHDLSKVPYVKDYDEGAAKQEELLSNIDSKVPMEETGEVKEVAEVKPIGRTSRYFPEQSI